MPKRPNWHTSGSVRPVKDPAILAAFAAEFAYCWACGCGQFPHRCTLVIHHIIKFGRCDERCNLFRVCPRCHDIIEGHCIRQPDGTRYSRIELEHVLYLKRIFDGRHYNRLRLTILAGRVTLPRTMKPPAVYYSEFCIARRCEGWKAAAAMEKKRRLV